MAMIAITCPDCVDEISMSARALLATLDLAGLCEPLGRVSWTCLSCDRLITTEIEMEDLLRLIAAGVPLIDDGFGANTVADALTGGSGEPQPHHERRGDTTPFTLEDLLMLHELLETDSWFQQLAGPADGGA